MATKKTPEKTYSIYARGTFDTTIEITANSLEDALSKSRELKIGAFVEFIGDCNDCLFDITGVHENG